MHPLAHRSTSILAPPPSISHIFTPTPIPERPSSISQAPLPAHDAIFTVIVRGKPFKLTYDQIVYDMPNLFTTAFLDGFSESLSRTLTIPARSPELFAVIYEYLAGYAVLPNPTIDLRNLLSDCEYYGLQRLKDELTLPKVPDALCSKHNLRRVVRLEDVAARRVAAAEWTKDGLVDTEDKPTNGRLTHLMVFLTKAMFKLDMTVRANGECSQASFAIELPPYALSLRSKNLKLRDDTDDWTALMAESLSSTPLTLNEGEFEGTFGDIVNWIGSFIVRFSPIISSSANTSTRPTTPLQSIEITEKLSRIMPGLAENLRARAGQGQTALKLSTSFWISEMSIIISPTYSTTSTSSHTTNNTNNNSTNHSTSSNNRINNSTSNGSTSAGGGGGNELVAKVLNCNMSTGLFRRNLIKPLVNL